MKSLRGTVYAGSLSSKDNRRCPSGVSIILLDHVQGDKYT